MKCVTCNEEVDTLYDCPQCDVDHCVDCRRPQDHDCTDTATDTEKTLDQPFGLAKHGVALLIAFMAVMNATYSSTAGFVGGILGGVLVGYALVYTASVAIERLRGTPTTQ